ncbi:FAD-dependent monooxygenase [Micromonospora sp. DR5-3]|uniref:FAD-dependent monooxygenase n=1 Tax=unclassified Micromonospora TaxID=2617518 RepID=UPI0011D9211B|nr:MULTISPECIES: FAD-dependent monooxygenase [unclassified Micromonospora]MCW3815383.1 FAD-dependent monooxygenase [Micromonospora sp. DR5-3]TYC22838.1 FAD-dependent monooxygenase [Micromonospora sp. MP36]
MSAVRTALVIGGGIGGTVTAMALARAGIEATVHEAYPGDADGVGAMLSLAPNGLAALRIVEAEEAVQAAGHPVPGVVLADGAGNQLSEFHGFPGLPATHAMARADLYRALTDHALARGVKIDYGKRLVAAEERPDAVTAVFADGSTASADVLIGADGIRSTVRTLIDPAAPGPEYAGVLGFGGLAAEDTVPAAPGTMYFAFGSSFIGYWRLPDGQLCWFASLPRTEPLSRAEVHRIPAEQWLAELRERYADHVPGAQLLAHTTPDTLMATGPVERMPSVPHWHRGRLVLVGDAVHAPSSSSGQGASLAIESAIELARCLRDLPDHAAFDAYERLRRGRVELIGGNAAATNRAKAGQAASPPTLPSPEQMFGPVHRHLIDWDATVSRAGQ